MVKMNLADKLILLRKENHLSQEEFAEYCGVSRQAVAKWESGKTFPDMFRLVDIADFFGIDVSDLFPATKRYKEKYKSIVDTLLRPCYAFYYSNLDTGRVLLEITENALDGEYLEKCNNLKIENCFSDEMDECHRLLLHPADYDNFKEGISKKRILEEFAQNDGYAVSYRMIIGNKVIYAQTVIRKTTNFEKTHNFITYVKDVTAEQEELQKKQTIIDLLSKNFSSAYYLDFEKDQFSHIKLDNLLQAFSGGKYDLFTDIDSCWEHGKNFAELYVCDEYREEFIKIVNPYFLRDDLKKEESFTYVFEAHKEDKRTSDRMKAIRADEDVGKILMWFERNDP